MVFVIYKGNYEPVSFAVTCGYFCKTSIIENINSVFVAFEIAICNWHLHRRLDFLFAFVLRESLLCPFL